MTLERKNGVSHTPLNFARLYFKQAATMIVKSLFVVTYVAFLCVVYIVQIVYLPTEVPAHLNKAGFYHIQALV